MIQIKCGTCGTSQGYKTAADGKLTLPREEEARLVARGVADYVTKPILNTASNAGAPAGETANSGQGVTPPNEGNAAPSAEETGSGDQPIKDGIALDDTLDIVDGHITKDSLLRMSRSDMEGLAADLGIDIRKCKNKGEIAELISAVELDLAETADGEDAPELGAEGPIV